jgi:hypothetical protein
VERKKRRERGRGRERDRETERQRNDKELKIVWVIWYQGCKSLSLVFEAFAILLLSNNMILIYKRNGP